MKAMAIAFTALVLTTSCSSELDINCDSSNIAGLKKSAKNFVLDNLSTDSKTSSISFTDFKVPASSCEANVREKYVRYRLTTKARENNKDKAISFSCKYSKSNKSGPTTMCQMN